MFENTLNTAERAELASIVSLPGFKVIQKIFETELEKYYTKWLNLPEGEDKEVILSTHRLAKAASQVYVGAMKRIQIEVEQHIQTPKATDKPIDSTEGLIDLGETYDRSDSRFDHDFGY